MKDTRVFFPALWQIIPLSAPASTMSKSLSIGGSSLNPPMGLLPSWVANMTDFPAIASHRSKFSLLPLSRRAGSVVLGSLRWKESNTVICMVHSVMTTELFRSFCMSTSAKAPLNRTQLRGLLCASSLAEAPTLLQWASYAGGLNPMSIRCLKSISTLRFPINVIAIDLFCPINLP
jgi:hypothetical protein